MHTLCALARVLNALACGEPVSVTDCRAQPVGHLQCVPPFIAFVLGQLVRVVPVAQDM